MLDPLQKVWKILTANERKRALLMLAMIVLMAFAELSSVISIMPFLSVIGRPDIVHENPWLQRLYQFSGASDFRSFIVFLGASSIALVIVSSVYKTVTLHLLNRFVHMLRHSLSTRLLERYIAQPYEYFLTRNPADLSKNVLSEIDQLTFNLLQPMSMLIAHGVVVVTMVMLIVAYNPGVALVIVATVAALYTAIYVLARRRLSSIGTHRQRAETERYRACSEVIGGIKEVKVSDTASNWIGTYARNSREVARHQAAAETLSAAPLYIVEAVGYTGLIAISLYLLLLNNDVGLFLPAIGMYGFAAYRMLPAIQSIYRGVARLRYSTAVLSEAHKAISMPVQQVTPKGRVITPRVEIRLSNVRYSYPGNPERPTFESLDLVVNANEILGIAGVSGGGKSTLIDILLGLLNPAAGTLTVDGLLITDENRKDWLRSVGYVPQAIYLFDGTVSENIAFGVPKHKIDMNAVTRAARVAQIHEFIEGELEHGYSTNIGDRGIRLSGGQRQRVGIARALYSDPPVIIMDEATSALDEETERGFTAAVKSLSSNKTMILVSHNKSTLSLCDRQVDISQLVKVAKG